MSLQRIMDNHLPQNLTLEKIYDEIRMRDAGEHPKAYIEYGDIIIEFSRASLKRDCIIADVRIFCK